MEYKSLGILINIEMNKEKEFSMKVLETVVEAFKMLDITVEIVTDFSTFGDFLLGPEEFDMLFERYGLRPTNAMAINKYFRAYLQIQAIKKELEE